MNIGKYLLSILLIAQAIYSWTCFYKAQFLVYDENYGILIHGFIFSVASLVSLIIIYIFRRKWIQNNMKAILLWILAGSPLTFALAFLFYQNIFGTGLTH